MSAVPEIIKPQLARLTSSPGVYQYFDQDDNLLYVGKAKNLAKRVASYWQNRDHSPWTERLVHEIVRIEVTEVKTELEALMLENSLIKSLHPKYNIQLQDDKTFPYLRVSSDDFPIVSITRKVKRDGAKYFGPYLSAGYLRTLLKLLQEMYGIRIAKDQSYEARSSVPAQIGLGARNLDDANAYQTNLTAALKFLNSPQPKLEKELRNAMEVAALNEEFEKATLLRDRLHALRLLRFDQTLFSATLDDCDYIGTARAGQTIAVSILHEREGSIRAHTNYLFNLPADESDTQLMHTLLSYLYLHGLAVPASLALPIKPEDQVAIEGLLTAQRGRAARIFVPQRGDKLKRLTTAIDNAHYQLKLESLKKSRREQALADLMTLLQLPHRPTWIEACDISNLGSNHIVGASIVFCEGQPAKREYRKYKIDSPKGQDDFASMRELVFRRLKNKNRPQPDLLIIDGGKGQLSAAMEARTLAKSDVAMISLAKKEELIYLPGVTEPIRLPHDSPVLLLLMAMRDEVHRFVISFHRSRRDKSSLESLRRETR